MIATLRYSSANCFIAITSSSLRVLLNNLWVRLNLVSYADIIVVLKDS